MDKKNLTLRIRTDIVNYAKQQKINLSSFLELKLQEHFQASSINYVQYMCNTQNDNNEFLNDNNNSPPSRVCRVAWQSFQLGVLVT